MTEAEILELVKNNPQSIIGQAYRLGRKTMNVELSPLIENLVEGYSPEKILVDQLTRQGFVVKRVEEQK